MGFTKHKLINIWPLGDFPDRKNALVKFRFVSKTNGDPF